MPNKKKHNITIVGSGYVGMSIATLLSQYNQVKVLDINSERVDTINKNLSPIIDKDISRFLKDKDLSLFATIEPKEAYLDADIIIFAVPTNYDEKNNQFDLSALNSVIGEAVSLNKNALMVIKSTIPMGYTEEINKIYTNHEIIFSPEFLREGKALFDNLYPSRIIIGSNNNSGKIFADIMSDASKNDNVRVLYMSSHEAEAVKLFSNSYLAMRVAYFNELDSYCINHSLDTESVINGVCLDDRIGSGYNNPSFGYGGYCFPKDTKQLQASFKDTPQNIITAIVESNETRKDFLFSQIIKLKPKIVGFYKLAMKKDSDNFRSSSIQGIIERVKSCNIEVMIYEPKITENNFNNLKVEKSINNFKDSCDLIVANRYDDELDDVKNIVFSRDIYGID